MEIQNWCSNLHAFLLLLVISLNLLVKVPKELAVSRRSQLLTTLLNQDGKVVTVVMNESDVSKI
jgi:hypothetical protein